MIKIPHGTNDQFVGADGPDGAAGGGGVGVEAGAGASRIDRPGAAEVPRSISASVSDKPMKITASTAVVRVSRLAVPRPDMNDPIPWELPMPRPPPSLRWISTTPIRAKVTNRWIISRTVLNARDLLTGVAAMALAHRRARLLPGLSGASNC